MVVSPGVWNRLRDYTTQLTNNILLILFHLPSPSLPSFPPYYSSSLSLSSSFLFPFFLLFPFFTSSFFSSYSCLSSFSSFFLFYLPSYLFYSFSSFLSRSQVRRNKGCREVTVLQGQNGHKRTNQVSEGGSPSGGISIGDWLLSTEGLRGIVKHRMDTIKYGITTPINKLTDGRDDSQCRKIFLNILSKSQKWSFGECTFPLF